MINVVSQYLVKLDTKAGDGSVNEGPADPHGRQREPTLTNGFLIGTLWHRLTPHRHTYTNK